MAKKTNDLDIHTFQIVPADESSVATPRFEELEEEKAIPAVKKSTSFKEISEAKVSARNKPNLMSKIAPKKKSVKTNASPSKAVKAPSDNKTNEILKGLLFGMGIVFVFIVADAVMLTMK